MKFEMSHLTRLQTTQTSNSLVVQPKVSVESNSCFFHFVFTLCSSCFLMSRQIAQLYSFIKKSEERKRYHLIKIDIVVWTTFVHLFIQLLITSKIATACSDFKL